MPEETPARQVPSNGNGAGRRPARGGEDPRPDRASWLARLVPAQERRSVQPPGWADLGLPNGTAEAGTTTRPAGQRDPVLGICCSGGGIRSAAFSLGALQALSAAGLYQRAKFVTSVSGGGYIAGSFATVRAGTEGGVEPEDRNSKDGNYAYQPGSPEDRYLRTHMHYLAPDARVALRGVLALLFGLVMNLGLLLVWVFLAARLTGTAARLSGVHFELGGPGLTGPWWWWSLGPAILGLGIAIGISERLTDVYVRPAASRVESLRHWAWRASVAGAGVTALMVLAPALGYGLRLLATKTGALAEAARLLQNIAFAGGDGAAAAKGAGVAATLVAVVRQLLKSRAGNWLTHPDAAAAGAAPTRTGAAGWLQRLRNLLLPWFGSALVVLAVGIATLRWLRDAALDRSTGHELELLAGALVVFLLIKLFSDINRSSLHVFYRERLASAFTIRRVRDESTGRLVAEPVPYERAVSLRNAAPADGGPELIVCAAANVTDEHVPPGRGSVPFTFTAKDLGVAWMTPVPASKTADDPGVEANRDEYRCDLTRYTAAVGPRLVTLPAAVAVSAAAVSPLMGRFTRPSVRLLLGVANVRLGLWLPNPGALPDPGHDMVRGWLGRARWQLRQPGVRLLLSELMGRTHLNKRWLYVTDGGHYDNLGLVEALRRRPTHVIVLDGTGDAVDSWSTLGNAIALARTELGIEIDIDPTAIVQGIHPPSRQWVATPVVSGKIHYPTGGSGPLDTGTLWLLKLGVVDDEHSPWDVRAYTRGHPSFPTDGTIHQLYGDQQFEAYRELGYTGGRLVVDKVSLPAEQPAPPAPVDRDAADPALSTSPV